MLYYDEDVPKQLFSTLEIEEDLMIHVELRDHPYCDNDVVLTL